MNGYFESPITYAVKHADNERSKSQSGGMFAALSDEILDRNGVIYGCIFNEKFEAVHVRTDNKTGRDAMRYSKYVQSKMNLVFKEVVEDLIAGRVVLFSGTSCQIAGLRRFVDVKLGNNNKIALYTVDIVCHGVPSPLVWKDYLEWEQKRSKSNIKHVTCRNKRKYGWESHVTSLEFANKKIVNSRVFPKIFYGHNVLRPSCYRCPYKSVIHPGDITIADYWGIDKVLPGFKDDKGVSLVLINNLTGLSFFEMCKDKLTCQQTKVEDSIQKPLVKPYDPPRDRNLFWQDYLKQDFGYIAKKYGGYSCYNDIKWKVRYWIKREFGI